MQLSRNIDEKIDRLCKRLSIVPRQGLFSSVIVWALDMTLQQIRYYVSTEEFKDIEPLLYKGIGARPVKYGDTVVVVPGLKAIDIMRERRDREVKEKKEKEKLVGIYEERPVRTNVRYYFVKGVYYQGYEVVEEPYSEYIISEKKDYYVGDIWVCKFREVRTQYRYYEFLKDMLGTVETREKLRQESYYPNVGVEYMTDAANNYQDTVKILAILAENGYRYAYCPGDGIGIGVMAGIFLRESGYHIDVDGSDKYLRSLSPVKLDRKTAQHRPLYLYVNSYSFCGPENGTMIVYDRQTPQMLDKINGREPRVWYRVRPFLYTTDIKMVSMFIGCVTNYERERGPMVNSVFFSLNDGSPFDKTRGDQVVVLPISMDMLVDLESENSRVVFFRGKYQILNDKVVLSIGKGKFTSYHYLSFPNDIVNATPYSVTSIVFQNRAAMFWSSVELLGYDNYAVQTFMRNQGIAYLYYVPLKKDRYVMLRYHHPVDDEIKTVLMYTGDQGVATSWEKYMGEETDGYLGGLCINFIEKELRETSLYSMVSQEGFRPSEKMVKSCEEFCSHNCNHKKKESDD